MKKTTISILTILFTICCLSLVTAEIPTYMWQDDDLNTNLFGITQNENDPTLFTITLDEQNFRDTVRVCVIKLIGKSLTDIDGFDIIYTSPTLRPGIQNAIPITLAYIEGTYKIQFESVSLLADGSVNENQPIYILHEINIDGHTMSVIPTKQNRIKF